MFGRFKPPILAQGRGQWAEAQRAKSEDGVVGDGAASPLPQLGDLGSIVSSPSGVRGRALAAERFLPRDAMHPRY